MRIVRFLVALIVAFSAAGPVLGCGTTAVCSDASTSLVGEIISEGFRISWSSANEDSALMGYKLFRWPCADQTCSATLVANVAAAGSCNTNQPYSVDDSPGSGSWTYEVRVIRNVGTTACSIFVTP